MNTVGLKVLIVLLALKVHHSLVQQSNYVKPQGNTTCPGDPCLTLQEYAEAASLYFVSNVDFVFIPGTHYLDFSLRLTNLSYVHLQGDSKDNTTHVFFMPLAKITFTSCYNITLSHLSFTLTGSRIGFSMMGFSTVEFQNSSVTLAQLIFHGTRIRFYSRALFFNFSTIQANNIRVEKAVSIYGAVILVRMSTLHISGNNYFNHNIVKLFGGALYSLKGNITFSGSNIFEDNTAPYGGALYSRNSNITFSGSNLFEDNTALFGGAIRVDDTNINFSGESHFLRNHANQEGGAIVNYRSRILLSGATFKENHAYIFGGALSSSRQGSHVTIEDTSMIDNIAEGTGGAIVITNGILQFRRSNFIENNWSMAGGGGMSAINVAQLILTGDLYFRNNTSNGIGGGFYVALSNIWVHDSIHFENNCGYDGGAVLGMSTKFDIDSCSNITFERNEATRKGGAVLNIDTTWNVKGSITFDSNLATMGGAMSLSGKSKLTLNEYSTMTYTNNHASQNGGAIYVNEIQSINECRTLESIAFCYLPNSTKRESCKRLGDCFIELNADMPFDASNLNISVTFTNNFAAKSGSVIFGGSLDNCRLYLGGGFQDDCGNKIGREYTDNSLQTFLVISTIDNMTSAISSEPLRICFCNDGLPNCEVNVSVNTVRGKQFTLSAVTVGQGNFTVPSSIKADFNDNYYARISHLQRVQSTGDTCTDLSYRVFSDRSVVTLILFPDGPCRDTGIARREVKITFLPCPDGFVKVGSECLCDERLHTFNVICNVDQGSISRSPNTFWLMGLYDNFSYLGILLHQSRCPLDFCVEHPIEIHLDNPDIQCNHNHSGVVCGSCVDNFSVALGTLHCLPCSNIHLLLLLTFAFVGFLLVAVIILLQLTVARGTMNGLIFYANVVQENRGIFFPPSDSNILTVFIAWLNLDLGIETCFYDGMDTYMFVWLQYAFPFYVWFLIGLVIVVSRHSRFVAKILGSNPVSVLATLLLMSYSKILRTIILSLSRTSLHYPDGSHKHVWLFDANVPYLQRADHTILGVFSIFALLFLFLPYTFLLLCGTWIQAYSHWKIFSWINKIKPFMDAYYAPYKKESRYWTGFLLLVRCALFFTFAFNALGSASVNLLTITSVTVGLAVLAWLQKGLYEKIYNDILEAFFILNLCIFAAATYHVKETKGSQSQLAYISVGLSFLFFVGIIIYHAYICVIKTSCWKHLPRPTYRKYLKQFLRRKETDNRDETVDEVNWSSTHVVSDTVSPPSIITADLNEPFLEY